MYAETNKHLQQQSIQNYPLFNEPLDLDFDYAAEARLKIEYSKLIKQSIKLF